MIRLYEYLVAVHIISFMASLLFFAGYGLLKVPKYSARKTMLSIGLALGSIGVIGGIGLLLLGGSIQRVCVSSFAYAVIVVVLVAFRIRRTA